MMTPMSLSTMPKQIEARLPQSVRESHWARTVAVGALITGVILLLSGKRKPAVAIAAIGTVVALAEEPHTIKDWWESMPGHIKAAQHFLAKIEGFVEQLAEQGETVRRLIRK